eukprot:8064783-Pyramimonas_sp.AAC.1
MQGTRKYIVSALPAAAAEFCRDVGTLDCLISPKSAAVASSSDLAKELSAKFDELGVSISFKGQ